MSLCKDCVSGVVHEGTPEGKWEQIGGVNSYIATPTIEYPKDKVVLLLTDVFGPQLINSQLLADSFAKNGFMTIVPDYLINDPIPPDALNPGSTFDLGTWLQKHPAEITRPALNKVIAALKQRGIVRFAATGYCFGGRYVFDLAIDGLIQVAATSHPSLLKIPEDLE
ncbi:Protein AIM2, partial [Termitomyces sp. T112]